MQSALIVEDIAEVRTALQDVLQKAFPGVRVQAVGTVADATSCLRSGSVELVLLDLGLPDGNGIDVLREFRGSLPRFVITTIFDDDDHLFEALRAGADGYLLKDEPADILVDLLRGIHGGRPPLSATIARRILTHFRPAEPQQSSPLSPRETEVLTLIARGYTVRAVAESLGMSYNTAAGHLKSIYQKLSVSSRAEATMEALRLGVVRS